MTNGFSSRRRRAAVSLSMSTTGSDPIGQLDRVVQTFHQVNRTLSTTALSRTELIALCRHLAQISGALLALTDQLSSATQQHDRSALQRTYSGAALPVAAGSSLQSCREGIRATYLAARAFYTDLR